MPRMTGGEAIVQTLIALGVDTLFGLPGVQNDYLYNALFDQGDRIRVIHTRHEQGAAYMALGYALTGPKPGVYNVVPGPGLLNTTAALATAYARNAPVLCLTGQIATSQIGRGYGMLHEIPDQLAVLAGLTKWAARINSPAGTPELVAEAFRQMLSSRVRPVGLEVAPDVLAAKSEVDLSFIPPVVRRPPVDLDAVEEAAKLLAAAKQPLIFIGGGAAEAGEAILHLAEMLQAPVIPSFYGRGTVSDRHYLSQSWPAGNRLWATTDVVLAIGTRLQVPLMNWGVDDDLKVVRIDIDPLEPARIAAPAVGIVADAKDALDALVPAVARHTSVRASRRDELLALKAEFTEKFNQLMPQMGFLRVIREELPDDGFLVEEMTQVSYVARFAMPFFLPKTLVTTGYQGTLGWGFATALGVKVANPDKAVISVTGDGGFLFTASELATAVQQKIATVTLVFNDHAYGNVRRMQKERYDNRIIASDLHNPDFVKFADSFGAQALRANSLDELRAAIRCGLAASGPTVVEIPVGEMPKTMGVLLPTAGATCTVMSYGRLTRFLLPLAITSIVVELGSQFLSAGMARAPEAIQTLAAYGLAWGLVLLITSPLAQARELGLVLVGTPQSLRQTRRFVVALGLSMTALLASLTLTPVGDIVIERLHGIDRELGLVVRTALFLLIPYPLIYGFARFHAGLLLRGQRTALVSYATLTNLAISVAAVLVLLSPGFIQRRPILLPVIVTYAGLLCELAIVTWGAYRYRSRWLAPAPAAPGPTAHTLTVAAILRFFWPLVLIMLIQELSRPVINLFVARGPDATAALAILAILYTLGRIPYGWLNDLRNLASAFRGERHSLHYIRNFVVACAGVSFAMFVILFWTPLRPVILEQWIGVEAALAARAIVPLVIYSLFSVVVAARAWFHGLGLVERRTPAMAPSAPARLAAIIATLVLLPYLGIYGATLGVMALFMGFLVETITVWWGIRGRRWLAERRALTPAA